ncbi:MAG: NAD-dependent epimerase/dehydratase family protein [Spirochaetes bacterium]|nr:NAD-dependent epimerase/dehydratase family protein [Spirochaetota bacterium]MBU1079621.1 NAD-dependent epimerase/dehydratase family protein [Spirochaetota bacterium]
MTDTADATGRGEVVVTGADGFLGSNVVRALLSSGYRARAVLEPGRETGTLTGLDVARARGSLLDPGFAAEVARGASGVVHTAASTAVWPSRIPSMRALNVDAALRLARAAKAAGVPVFVHVGSASSFEWGAKELPGDERGGYGSARFGLDYLDTKREAQEAMLALDSPGFRVVVVNPTFMFGPYDSRPSSGEMILALAAGKIPGYTAGGRSFADVRSVASGVVAALGRGRGGQCYILGGVNLSYKEAFAAISEAVGARPPGLRLPGFAALAYGALGSSLSRLTGKPPKLSLAMTRVSLEGQYYDSSKAERELGYAKGSLKEAVVAAAAWFRERGML